MALSDDVQTLRTLAAEMRALRVERVRLGEVEVVLHSSAFDPVPEELPEEKPEKPDVCACGHHLVTEHTNNGCLFGCRVELCDSKKHEE